MIAQDSYWRKDLIKFGERLEKRYRQDKWPSRIEFSVEKDVFLSFYIIRKLLERNKNENGLVSSRVVHAQHKIVMYPIVAGVKPMNVPKTFALSFQLFKGQIEMLKLEDICNQFIHSFIFSPFVPFGNVMVGIYFASDRQSKKGLYYITLAKVIEIIISVAKNKPVKLKVVRKAGIFKVNLG